MVCKWNILSFNLNTAIIQNFSNTLSGHNNA